MTTAQQWARFDALVDKLARLPPEQFDYAIPRLTRDTGCGCVAAHAAWFQDFPVPGGRLALAVWLGIRDDEAYALWDPSGVEHTRISVLDATTVSVVPNDAIIGPLGRRYLGDPAGAPGLAEALRRLRVLETRYSR